MKSKKSDSMYYPEYAFAEINRKREEREREIERRRCMTPTRLRYSQVWNDLIEFNRKKREEEAAAAASVSNAEQSSPVSEAPMEGPLESGYYSDQSSLGSAHSFNNANRLGQHYQIPVQPQYLYQHSVNAHETVSGSDSAGQAHFNPNAQKMFRYASAPATNQYEACEGPTQSQAGNQVVPSYYIAVPPPSYFVPYKNKDSNSQIFGFHGVSSFSPSAPMLIQNGNSGVPIYPQAPVYVASPFGEFGHGVAQSPNGQAFYYYPHQVQPASTTVLTPISDQYQYGSSSPSSACTEVESTCVEQLEQPCVWTCKLNPCAPEFRPRNMNGGAFVDVNDKNTATFSPRRRFPPHRGKGHGENTSRNHPNHFHRHTRTYFKR